MMTYYSSCPETDDGKKALKMTLRILDAMNNGGIHDHVGQVDLDDFFFDDLSSDCLLGPRMIEKVEIS